MEREGFGALDLFIIHLSAGRRSNERWQETNSVLAENVFQRFSHIDQSMTTIY